MKRFLLTTARFLFPRPFADFSFKMAYLSRLSRWLREHPCPRNFPEREDLYRYVVESERLDAPIDYLEFGVFQGHSFSWWLANVTHPAATFVGFDSFQGLPDRWGVMPRGAYSAGGRPPEIGDRRCHFEVGLFHETLPGFLRQNPRKRRTVVLHDEDLYGSTLFTLTEMATYLQEDDILILDDFGSARAPTHQFRAFMDFCDAYPVSVEVLAVSSNRSQVALKLRTSFPPAKK
jgi:hypothetical protein